jgi:catechol 2,3-dioxygenase-like lactoylglutathione lyase family enzyme
MIKTLGLTHLALAVRDLDRAIAFYQRAFGARILFRSDAKVEVSTGGSNDVISLELSDSAAIGSGGGIGHFGFRLARPEDIAGAATEIEAAGGVMVSEGEFAPGEPYLFARDPDGYTIEIWYEREQSPAT